MTKRRRPADPPRVEWVPGQLHLPGTYDVTEPGIVAGKSVSPGDTVTVPEPSTEDYELHAAPPDKVTAADRRMARALAWRAEGLRERVAAALAAHHYELEIVTLFELRGFCWCGGWSTAVDYSGKLTDLTAALHAEWAEHRLDAIVAAVASPS